MRRAAEHTCVERSFWSSSGITLASRAASHSSSTRRPFQCLSARPTSVIEVNSMSSASVSAPSTAPSVSQPCGSHAHAALRGDQTELNRSSEGAQPELSGRSHLQPSGRSGRDQGRDQREIAPAARHARSPLETSAARRGARRRRWRATTCRRLRGPRASPGAPASNRMLGTARSVRRALPEPRRLLARLLATHLLLAALAELEDELLQCDRAAEEGLVHVGRLELGQRVALDDVPGRQVGEERLGWEGRGWGRG